MVSFLLFLDRPRPAKAPLAPGRGRNCSITLEQRANYFRRNFLLKNFCSYQSKRLFWTFCSKSRLLWQERNLNKKLLTAATLAAKLAKLANLAAKGNTKPLTFLVPFNDQIFGHFDHPRPQRSGQRRNGTSKPQFWDFWMPKNPKLALLRLKIFTFFRENFQWQIILSKNFLPLYAAIYATKFTKKFCKKIFSAKLAFGGLSKIFDKKFRVQKKKN